MAIYTWGSNGSGQLGIGHEEDTSVPTLHVQDSSHDQETPQAIEAGGNHTLILYKTGRLAVTGKPSGKIQGAIFEGIKLCSATWDASFLLNNSNQLLAFGIGERGELGLGQEQKQTSGAPIAIDLHELKPANTEIVHLASGVQHTVVVLSNGEVLGWGNGRKGQIGQPAEVVWKPRKVNNITFKVMRAVCGQGFTFLVGDPKQGQCVILGQDKFGIKANCPDCIPGWKDVGTSWGSLFVLFEDGRLMSWGRNDHGQLAPSNLLPVHQIAVGSEHALARTKDGRLFAWGWGEHGNCGVDIDDAGDAKEAKEIEMPTGVSEIQGIGAGCATSWFWT